MDREFWVKQGREPLFPDLLWSRPENKRHAGKLLIIGGNLYGFAAPAEAYQAALEAGIGTARVLLPDCLHKTLRQHMADAEFAPSNPSGSFGREALAAWLEQAAWADAVLLAGDLGRNSETAIVIESFLSKYPGQVTLTKDAADYVTSNVGHLLSRPDTTLAISLAQLQKLAKAAGEPAAVTFGMSLLQLVDWLHDFTIKHPINVVVRHLDNIFVAAGGQVSTTKLPDTTPSVWRVKTAGRVSVWWLQQPERTFPALTTALIDSV